MSQMRTIRDYMTHSPRLIDAKASLEEAFAIMEEYNLRHLPVEREHRLVGILSDRDIAKTWPKRSGEMPLVEAVMTRFPYTVDPDTPMAEVLQVMAENKLGCVVVKSAGEKIVGIFTTTDGLRILAHQFSQKSMTA